MLHLNRLAFVTFVVKSSLTTCLCCVGSDIMFQPNASHMIRIMGHLCLSCTVPLIHLSLFLVLLGVLDEFLVEQGVDGFTLFSDVMVKAIS